MSAPEEHVITLGPVLVAEDDAAGRLLIRTFLRKMGLANPVVECEDGGEAVSYLERVEAGEAVPPVLLLVDLHMPVRSGFDVLRWLAARPALEVPAIMLTGSATGNEMDDAYRLGVLAYLVKPVGFGALEEVIRRKGALPWALVGARSAPAPPAPPAGGHREEASP